MSNDFWRTPPDLFAYWNDQFRFNLDAAANQYDTFCETYISEETNALAIDWCKHAHGIKPSEGRAWVNPPYSPKGGPLIRWVQKFIEERDHGWTIVALLPADTSTKWWDLIWDRSRSKWKPGIQGHFLSPRVKHRLPHAGEPGYDPTKKQGSPTWGSAIIIFKWEGK